MSHEISIIWSKIAPDVAKAVNEKAKGKIEAWHKNGKANGKLFTIKIEIK